MTIAQVLARAAATSEKVAADLRAVIAELEEHERVVSRFRQSSAARLVAEMLLAAPGQWVAKSSLADAAQVAPSTVPIVVRRLRETGVEVERQIVNGQALYRVAGESS